MGTGGAEAMRRYWRFTTFLVVSAAGLMLVGWIPTQKLGGEPAVRAMLIACLVCFAGSIVGSLPLAMGGSLGRSLRATPSGALASLAVRFTVVVALAALVALAGWAEPRSFLIWVGICYLVFLVVDVRYALAQQAA